MKRLTLEKREGLGVIRLDDGKANAIQDELLSQLDVALETCERDPDLGAVVLEGRDGFFSAGMDLKLVPTLGDAELRATLTHLCETTNRVFTFPKPIVAALTGHTVAGGAIFALAADLRVAAAGTYRIGLSEVAIGVPLPSFILAVARESLPAVALTTLCLHGQLVSPDEAARAGIVHEVSDLAEVRERAAAQARRLSKLKNPAYVSTKRRLRGPQAAAARQALDRELDEFVAAFRTVTPGR